MRFSHTEITEITEFFKNKDEKDKKDYMSSVKAKFYYTSSVDV